MPDREYYQYDLESFINKKKNVLFITGMMGSGKSTLARSFSTRYNAKVISLDFFFNWNSDYVRSLKEEEKSIIYDFYTKCGFYKKLSDDFGSFTSKWNDLCPEDRTIIGIKTALKLANSTNRYILEGVHLYTYSALFDSYKNEPIVAMKVSSKAARDSDFKRARERNQRLLQLLIDLPYKIEYYNRHDKLYNEYITKLNLTRGDV